MSVTLHKFIGEYGNYADGHSADVSIEGVTLWHTTPEPSLTYTVKYADKRALPYAMYITTDMIEVMRAWLVSKPIVGDVARDYREADILRRVEQYYGHHGLKQFVQEYERAYEHELIPA